MSQEVNHFAEGGAAFREWYACPTPYNVWCQSKNPYPWPSQEHKDWDTGWDDAFYYQFGHLNHD